MLTNLNIERLGSNSHIIIVKDDGKYLVINNNIIGYKNNNITIIAKDWLKLSSISNATANYRNSFFDCKVVSNLRSKIKDGLIQEFDFALNVGEMCKLDC